MGIQPVVNLTMEGKKIMNVKAGKKVDFSAIVEVPKNTGKIVSAEWDFEGDGSFPIVEKSIQFDQSKGIAIVKASYTFKKAGTYFPTVRVASQREGNLNTPFTRIQNLDRVRIIVE